MGAINVGSQIHGAQIRPRAEGAAMGSVGGMGSGPVLAHGALVPEWFVTNGAFNGTMLRSVSLLTVIPEGSRCPEDLVTVRAWVQPVASAFT